MHLELEATAENLMPLRNQGNQKVKRILMLSGTSFRDTVSTQPKLFFPQAGGRKRSEGTEPQQEEERSHLSLTFCN